MRKGNRASLALAGLLGLIATPCVAWQSFPQPEAPAQSSSKPKAQQQDSGFAPPAAPPPPAAPRSPEQPEGFKIPETATPDQLPPKSQPTAISLGTNPLMTTARDRFLLARQLTDFRAAGSSPFRAHAIFSAMGNDELANGGTYTETWMSPTRWRREAVCGSVHVVESREGDQLYRQISGAAFSPRAVDNLLDALQRTLPQLDDTFFEADWQQGAAVYEGASVLRLAKDFGGVSQKPEAAAYWLDHDGKIRAGYENGTTIEYADYEEFNGKQVARHLNLKENGVKVAGIWIDQISAAPSDPATQFTIDGVTPIPLSDSAAYSGPYFVPPQPVHQVSPKDPPAGTGTITVAVHLDARGHVRSAQVKSGINPALDEAATKAAMEWEFSPALIKGRPAASDATVQFSF